MSDKPREVVFAEAKAGVAATIITKASSGSTPEEKPEKVSKKKTGSPKKSKSVISTSNGKFHGSETVEAKAGNNLADAFDQAFAQKAKVEAKRSKDRKAKIKRIKTSVKQI